MIGRGFTTSLLLSVTLLAAGCVPAREPAAAWQTTFNRSSDLQDHVAMVLRGDVRGQITCKRELGSPQCPRWQSLVNHFRNVAFAAPTDTLVQNIAFYSLVRLEAYDEALGVLNRCWAEEWWCAALEGFAHAERGGVIEAGAAFDRALAAMPPDEWCAWNDFSLLMSDDEWNAYVVNGCLDGDAQLTEFWWLSDPAWIVPGNDRKVEHYDRMVLLALHDDFVTGEAADNVHDGHGHGTTHHEHAIAYGDETIRLSMRWISHRAGQTVGTLPRFTALAMPLRASAADWRIDPAGAWERYVPYFGALVAFDEYQLAFFERGDSILAIAAMTTPDDPAFTERSAPEPGLEAVADAVRPVLLVATGPDTPALTFDPIARGDQWLVQTTLPRRRYIVGFEAASDAGVARARMGHGLPQEADAPVRLSDLLLYSPDGLLPDSPVAVVPLMRAGSTWRPDEAMGVFLEVYGPNSITSYPISVELARIGADPGDTRPINIQWSQPGSGSRYPISFTLDLRDAVDGDYTLRLQIGAGEQAVSVVKDVRIERGG